jgi:hypothetical protein
MPPGASLGVLVAALIAIPFVMARDLGRLLLWLNRWRLRRSALPPPLLNRSRAVAACFVLVLAIEIALQLPALIGRGLDKLIADFMRTPHDPPTALAVLAAALVLSLLFLIIGFRGARGAPTDPIAAMIALFVSAGCIALLRGEWFLPVNFGEAARYGNPLLRALYIATLAAALMRAWLSTRPFGGGALRRIRRHIQNRMGRLRPARPRSY